MMGQARQHHFEQAQLFAQLQRASGPLDGEGAVNLFDQPRRRGLQQQLAMALDRRARGRLDLETQLGQEPHRAHHPHRVFLHPDVGVAHRAD